MTEHETTAITINELIQTLKNGEFGFNEAARDVSYAPLKDYFRTLPCQRAEFGQALNRQVRKLHQAPGHSGSLLGAIHRGWIRLHSRFVTRSDEAVIADCERAEGMAVQAFRAALTSETLIGAVRELVAAQFAEIQEAHHRVGVLGAEANRESARSRARR